MKLRTILIAVGGPLLLLGGLRSWVGGAAPGAAPAPAAARSGATYAPPHDGRARAVAGVPDELVERGAEEAGLAADPAPGPRLSLEERKARDDQRVAAKQALLARTFAADVRDPSWSPGAERRVHDAFGAAALPGARLAEASCGGTLCRITVAFDSIEHRNEGYAAVVELVRWPSRGFGSVSTDDPLRYVFYASRDQRSFPRGDPRADLRAE